MQIDHIVPKYRNNEMWHQGEIGSDEISNLNPSCRMCNFYKGMYIIDIFRENLKDTLMRNVQRPFNFRLAERYGMVEVKEWNGKFQCYDINKIKLDSVHQLQHALRLCGLDGLADNFKV